MDTAIKILKTVERELQSLRNDRNSPGIYYYEGVDAAIKRVRKLQRDRGLRC